jgi:hypothetical protein
MGQNAKWFAQGEQNQGFWSDFRQEAGFTFEAGRRQIESFLALFFGSLMMERGDRKSVV